MVKPRGLEITCFFIIFCVALIAIEYKVVLNFLHLRYHYFHAKVITSVKDYCRYSQLELHDPHECICRLPCAFTCPSTSVKNAHLLNKSCLQFEVGETYKTDHVTLTVLDEELNIAKEECKHPNLTNNTIELEVFCETYQNPNSVMTISRKPRAYAILFVSIPCLLITVAVYLVLPELLNHHGKALLCHMTSQIIVYLEIAVVRLAQFELQEHHKLCTGLGVTFQIFFIACFTWLSVASYDIWKIFELRSSNGTPHGQREERRQFLIHSAWAWGVPLTISILSAIMNYIPNIPSTFKPHFANIGCRRQGSRYSLYVSLPVGLYLCLILMIFLVTSYRLWAHDKHCTATDVLTNKISFLVYLKLFIVTGLCWLVGILVAGYGGDLPMVLSDILNISQGPAFFIIFVCKRPVFHMLYKRVGYKVTLRRSSQLV